MIGGALGRTPAKHVERVRTCRMERMDVMEFPGILLNV